MTVRAYAKLNLTLEVTGVRADGMHELRMIMQEVDLFDELTFSHQPGLSVNIPGVHPTNNTVYKAAQEFFTKTRIPANIHIDVKKIIPMQSGMGGGSADAATVLKTLNIMHNTPITTDELAKIGNTVGADVPFCLAGGCRIARGTGDVLTKLTNNLNVHYLIAKPEKGVNTAEAFALHDKLPSKTKFDFDKCKQAIIDGNLPEFTPHNDLQRAACELCPDIASLLDQLNKYTNIAFMTGSGSACVGVFENKSRAQMCADKISNVAHYVQLTQSRKA